MKLDGLLVGRSGVYLIPGPTLAQMTDNDNAAIVVKIEAEQTKRPTLAVTAVDTLDGGLRITWKES